MNHQTSSRIQLTNFGRARGRFGRLLSLRALALSAITVATLGSAVVPAAAAPLVYVNGVGTGIDAVVRGNQVFVPVRGVFEKLGTAVNYTPPSSVVARKAHTDLAQLTLGSVNSIVNGTPHTLSNAPFRQGSRVFVPLRLISQAAGATVVYTATQPHTVQITSPRSAPVIVAASPVPAAPAAENGIPWWVWLLLGVLALAIVLWLLSRRRKPDPIISTRSTTSDPNIRTRQ